MSENTAWSALLNTRELETSQNFLSSRAAMSHTVTTSHMLQFKFKLTKIFKKLKIPFLSHTSHMSRTQ